jgi:predicted TIM-barrel fold metal-dependent hydrolase
MVRGIRQKPVTSATPDAARRGLPGSMDDERWRRGYALLGAHGMSYDLQAPWWNLDQAAALARDFPGTQIILNHTGLPSDRSEAGLKGWREAMATLATQPNVAVKLSGLGLPGRPWTQHDNVPVLRDAIAIFGARRVACSPATTRWTAWWPATKPFSPVSRGHRHLSGHRPAPTASRQRGAALSALTGFDGF